jgi:hypothetical protein
VELIDPIMYEKPTKGALDRTLSFIMHDARKKAMAERIAIVSEATARGALNSRVPFTIAAAGGARARGAFQIY